MTFAVDLIHDTCLKGNYISKWISNMWLFICTYLEQSRAIHAIIDDLVWYNILWFMNLIKRLLPNRGGVIKWTNHRHVSLFCWNRYVVIFYCFCSDKYISLNFTVICCSPKYFIKYVYTDMYVYILYWYLDLHTYCR